jgi:hypothetical protein
VLSTIVWACVRDAIFGSRSGRQVEEFATDRGWTYTARDKSLETLWTLAPFLGRRLTLKGVMKKQLVGGFDKTGYLPRASYVAAGQIGNWSVRVFEYSFGGRGVDEIEYSRVRRFSVCAVTLPRDRPLLDVHPESLGSRLAGRVKMTQDIDFESEDFNRAFVIRSPDRKFAYGHWISCRGSYSPQPRTLGSLSVTITRMSRALCSQTSAIAYRPCEAPIGCFTRAGR